MKKTLIAPIFLAAFNNESFSQTAQTNVSIVRPIALRPIQSYEHLNVPVPPKLIGTKMLVELYNANGKLMIWELVNGNMITLYTGELPAGNYELRICWRGGSISYPVIKIIPADKPC